MSYEIKPGQIFYNRTGNLSANTVVNSERAARFMAVSDLRRDVEIIDSDKDPEKSAVRVGSDVLAWETVTPMEELTKIVLRSQKFRQTEVFAGKYRIQIHHKVIDSAIQTTGYHDKDDYNRRFLQRLRGEIKGGLFEFVTWEKLGLRDQAINYLLTSLSVAIITLPGDEWYTKLVGGSTADILIRFGMLFFFAFPSINLASRPFYPPQFYSEGIIPPYITNRRGFGLFLPSSPVDRWIRGSYFLLRNGDRLIDSFDNPRNSA